MNGFNLSIILILLSSFSVVIINSDSNNNNNNNKKVDEKTNCDKAINALVEECTSIRNMLTSDSSFDANIVCCKYARYDLCMGSLKRLLSSTQAMNICQESKFDEKIKNVEPDNQIKNIQKKCENYDKKQCITNVLSDTWNTINQHYNLTEISSTLSKNVNEAMESIGGFFKNIQNRFQS